MKPLDGNFLVCLGRLREKATLVVVDLEINFIYTFTSAVYNHNKLGQITCQFLTPGANLIKLFTSVIY
jgi:hypothetical protein